MEKEITVANKMKGWKRFVNPNPSREVFEFAWLLIYKHPFDECVLAGVFKNGSNHGFTIQTPSGIHINGGFGFHTDFPVLDDPSDEYYSGYGCTWGVDKNGVRYYKLCKETGLPKKWDEVRATETIRVWIANNAHALTALPSTNHETK